MSPTALLATITASVMIECCADLSLVGPGHEHAPERVAFGPAYAQPLGVATAAALPDDRDAAGFTASADRDRTGSLRLASISSCNAGGSSAALEALTFANRIMPWYCASWLKPRT